MPPAYRLTVLAPDHTVLDVRVSSLVAPGSEGYFGVLARHARMVAELGIGELRIVEEEGGQRLFALSGGFLDVGEEGVTLLADTAEEAGEIDVARARAAKERAQQRVRQREADTDVHRAEVALRRALNRLHVVEDSGRRE